MTGSRQVRVAGRRRLLAGMCAAYLAILISVPAAFGQSASDQYDPAADPAGIVNTGSRGSDAAGSQNATANGSKGDSAAVVDKGNSKGGDIPFTGYPVTPLVGIVGLLLVGGVAIRLLAPVAQRPG